MKSSYLLRVICLLALLASFVPAGNVSALVSTAVPPVDMFQLPWEQGLAWVAIDGLDNGIKRPLSSSHNFTVGGAIDFAPHNNMVKGENTSTFWTTAAAAGTVVGTSACHVIIDHGNGWITQYQFLANVQVKLGDAVSRNQRLGIIADGVRQKFCPGSTEPNVPHLHFMLRPTTRNATFAGWQVNYLPVLNKTTFTKNGETLGLFKPLLNIFDAPATPTPTVTTTPTLVAETPSITPSPTRVNSPTPTLFGPYVSTTVDPLSILIGETAQASVRLNNVPAEGYTSAEFTCSFSANLVEVSNITVTSLFGTDAVAAIHGPQGNSFIVAIAGSNGNKATASGTVFTFDVKGLQVGETNLGCEARVSQGNNILTQIPSARTFLTVLSTEDTPTPNLTPGTPTVLPSACDKAEFIADVTVPPGTVMSPGTTFTKTWRLKNLGPCTWSTSYSLVFFYGERMGAVSSVAFPVNVSVGQTVDISINMTAPNAPGSYRGYWMFRNASGINFGIGPDANQPWFVDINVAGPTLPPSPTSTPVPWSPTPTITSGGPSATATPTPDLPPPPPASQTATPTIPMDWLTYTNSYYGFQFRYPPRLEDLPSQDNNYARIDLPFVQGTNLGEKYLQVDVVENANPCRSPVAASSFVQSSETVMLNGTTFLKETGQEPAAGNLYQFVAYSTARDNACVSLSFVLHSVNPGNLATPIPVFDYAAESAIFEQIIGTYTWLALSTATPGESSTPTVTLPFTATPTETPAPPPTSTAGPSPTPTPPTSGVLTGKVIASKPVRIDLIDTNTNPVSSTFVMQDGTFSIDVPPGTYFVGAFVPGFLITQGTVKLSVGNITTMPTITLVPGDVDS